MPLIRTNQMRRANHIIVECKGQQLLAVPSEGSGKYEQDWVICAVRKAEN